VTTVFVTPRTARTSRRSATSSTEASARIVVVSVMDSEEFVSDLAAQVDRVLVILYRCSGCRWSSPCSAS
jgi:putative ABC transport system permease protein